MKVLIKYGLCCTTILLILVCVGNILYPIFYAVSVNTLKNEQKEIISLKQKSADYILLQLKASAFKENYSEDEKELKLDGRMYDVVSVEHVDGIVICRVLADDKETELEKELDNNIAFGKTGKNSKHISCWMPLAYSPMQMEKGYLSSPHTRGFKEPLSAAALLTGYIGELLQPPKKA